MVFMEEKFTILKFYAQLNNLIRLYILKYLLS